MGRREEMVKLAGELMANRENIRNIGTVAHIDHGKCIAPETRIQLVNGMVLTAEQFFGESVLAGEKVRESGSETVFALKKPIMVFSVNKKTGEIEKKAVSHAWKLKGGKTLRVKLRNGNSLSTTQEHKFLVFDGLQFGFREAKELKVGERVTVARRFDCDSEIEIEAEALKLLAQKPFYIFLKWQSAEALKKKLEKRCDFFCTITKRRLKKRSFYDCLNNGRYLLSDFISVCSALGFGLQEAAEWIEKIGLKDSVKINWPLNWREIFFLAGLMIGDGSFNRFVVGKPELGKRFKEICNKLGFEPIERKYVGKTFEYQTNVTLAELLNALFDYPLKRKSHNVRISDFARQSPNLLLAELLKAYFDCDGTVEKARSAVSISTASEQMLKDLQLVLPRFGCLPIIGKKNTVYLAGDSVKSFVENIGFSLEEKKAKSKALASKSEGSTVCDTVPCTGLKKLRELQQKSKASVSHHYYKYENQIYVPQRSTFKQLVATLLKEKEATLPSINDLAFIEIKEIREEFEETVYDFSVPENQNFVAEGIVVHNTTLSDALIAAAGLISKEVAGVAQVMDYEDQEQERGITINAANISLVFGFGGQKTLINLIDTPGHVDFTGEVIRAMRAVDGVILVVDAVEGVMPQTETVIRQALKELVRPVLFINKVDRLINELKVTEEEMQNRFLKIITQVNNLIKKNAPEQFKEKWLVNPANGTVSFGSAKRKWAVSVPYMQKSNINFKQVYDYLKADRQKELSEISPVHEVVLQMVKAHLPNPIEAQKYRIQKIWGGDMEEQIAKAMRDCNAAGEVAMMITDVSVDPHAGDIATGRIYSGTLQNGMTIKLIGMQKEVRVQKVGVFMGADFIDVDKIKAGNIAAIVGIKEVFAGETISTIAMKPFESFMTSVEPVMTVSIEAKQTKDLPKLITVLKQLTKEDPNLRASINQETGEHLLSGMGELHLDVNRYRIEVTHGVQVTVGNPIVVFKETIKKSSSILEGKSPNHHNKFKLSVEPIPDELLQKLIEAKLDCKIRPKDKELVEKIIDMGFDREFSKRIWAIHNNCILADVTRGIQALHEIKELVIQGFTDAMDEGPLAKEKCLGVIVKLEDATLHEDSIHRGPAQVLPAITRTIFACMLSSDPILLEPKQTLFITAPQDYMGAVSRELGSRRTQINDIRTEGDATIFIAKAPVKELIGFSATMRGATSGRAVWTAEYAGYEPLPKELQSPVITEIRKRKGMDAEIKSYSYFLE